MPSLIKYMLKRIRWRKTADPDYPYDTVVNGCDWKLRINDFPESQLYTLIVDNEEIGDFDDWPIMWIR
jgi:hypothetical protein